MESLAVFEIVDAGEVERFIEGLQKAIKESNGIPPGIQLARELGSVGTGDSEIYKGVEIESIKVKMDEPIIFQGTNISEVNIWHAIKDNKLIFSVMSTPKPIKDYLDTIDGGPSAARLEGFYDMEDYSFDGIQMALLISPMSLIRAVLKQMSQSEEEIGMIYMLVQNIPDKYGIAFYKAKPDSSGVVRGRFVLSLVDLGPLFAMALMP
jgi:hypothetical protein